MKKVYACLYLVLILSCASEEKLTFYSSEITNENCKACASVSINVPKATPETMVSQRINGAVEGLIIDLLSFSENENLENLDAAILSFESAYEEIEAQFNESPEWEFSAEGEITYQTSDLICIEISAYIFTGGAHGYNSSNFLLFDPETGNMLGIEDVFKDVKAFKEVAEQKFRRQEGIPAPQSINSTGFMFEQDTFELPENIGFQEDQLVLIYNQYEVASYANGQIIVEIPIKEIRSMIKIL
ncbi:DUF3298 domain-containing protein [Flavobacteriaceae bacterium M23B6Z8]